MKRPSAQKNVKVNCGPLPELPPLSTCSLCHSPLGVDKSDEVKCTIVGSEIFETRCTTRKICPQGSCRATHRANFAYHDGVKVNTLTFTQLEALGIYMVTAKFGFTMKYLKMTYYRFLRGNLAPGQETSVRGMLVDDGEQALHPQRFQAHLMRALEGYALAKDCPGKVVPFEIDHPASFQKLSPKPFLFPPRCPSTAILESIANSTRTWRMNGLLL